MIIDGIEYAPVNNESEELRITIVDNRGLTFVGFVDIYKDSEILVIRDARCVIRWGTTKHIAQLVDGPIKRETTLGACADVAILKKNIVASYRTKGNWYE